MLFRSAFLALLAFATVGLSAATPLRIGYQKSGTLLLVKHDGALERRLAELGYTVEWREFFAGPPMIEALNAGSIDIGHAGDVPLLFAQLQGVPFRYVASSGRNPEVSAILVPKDSPLRTLADLKGRKLAFTKGSSSHYHAARALIAAGLTFADIKPIYLSPPNARAAFESGAIDAWDIWDPYYSAAEIEGNARVLAGSESLQPDREFFFGRAAFLEKNPGVIAPFIEVVDTVAKRALADPKGTSEFLAPRLGIKSEILLRAQNRQIGLGAAPLDATVFKELQEVADTFFKLGLFPRKIDVTAPEHAPVTPVAKP